MIELYKSLYEKDKTIEDYKKELKKRQETFRRLFLKGVEKDKEIACLRQQIKEAKFVVEHLARK